MKAAQKWEVFLSWDHFFYFDTQKHLGKSVIFRIIAVCSVQLYWMKLTYLLNFTKLKILRQMIANSRTHWRFSFWNLWEVFIIRFFWKCFFSRYFWPSLFEIAFLIKFSLLSSGLKSYITIRLAKFKSLVSIWPLDCSELSFVWWLNAVRYKDFHSFSFSMLEPKVPDIPNNSLTLSILKANHGFVIEF